MPFTGQLATVNSKPGNIEFGGTVPLRDVPAKPQIICQINWDDNPTLEFPPTGYTDISNRVRSFSTSRGRNNFIDRIDAGTGTVELDNRDGYLNPGQPGRLLMRRARLLAWYDNTYWPLLTGHIDSYEYEYPAVDHDAVCHISITDGMKVLAQQQFAAAFLRENETAASRIPQILKAAGIGTTYQSLAGTFDGNELAPVSVAGTDGTQTKSVTLTHGSSVVTMISTLGLRPGLTVTGPGIKPGLIISAVSPTTIQLSDTEGNARGAVLSASAVASGQPASSTLGSIDADGLGLSVGLQVALKNNYKGEAIFANPTNIVAIDGGNVVISPPTNNVEFREGFTMAATLSNLSGTVTVASTATLRVGMLVSGPGIPVGCVVGAITSGTTFTLANPDNPTYNVAYLSRTKDTQFPGNTGPWYEIAGISDTKDLSPGMHVGGATLGSTYLNINGDVLFDHTLGEVSDGRVAVTTAITNTWRGPSDAGGYASGVGFTAPASTTLTFLDPGTNVAVSFSAGTSQILTFPRPYVQVSGILDHIRQIEDTERGVFLVRGDGVYEYQGVGWRAAQALQVTFGEFNLAGAVLPQTLPFTMGGEIPYKEVPVVYDDTNLINEYNLVNVYGQLTTQITDATSDAHYFTRSQTIEQLFYDRTVSSLPTSQRVFEPIPRLEGLQVQPVIDPLDMWPAVLGLLISQKVAVRRRPLGGTDILSAYTQFVEGVQHEGDPSDWKITFITSPVRS